MLAAAIGRSLPDDWWHNFDEQIEALRQVSEAAVQWYADGHDRTHADVFLYEVADAIADAIQAGEDNPGDVAAARLTEAERARSHAVDETDAGDE